MRKPSQLELRGAADLIGRAQAYIGRNQKTDEWGSGGYLDKNIENANNILQLAGWRVTKEFTDMQEGK